MATIPRMTCRMTGRIGEPQLRGIDESLAAT